MLEIATTPDEFGPLLGQEIHEDGVIKRFVKNTESATALAAGDVVVYDLTAADGYSVKLSTTLSTGVAAGVVTEAIAVGEYGRIVVYGVYNSVKVDGGTTDVAIGDILDVATTGRAAKAGTHAAGSGLGVALQAATTGGSVAKVFVKTLGL